MGDFKDHLNRSHWAENKYARHKPKTSRLQKEELPYNCRVKNCQTKCGKNYKELNKHYKHAKHHTVKELLDAGVSAWFFRKEREDNCFAIAAWLEKENYVTIVESKVETEETVSENN